MTEALHLRVVRPYASEEEFLETEGWTLNLRSVLLIGVPPHPEGTPARVELTLSSGKAVVLAEGSVVKHLAETATRPAGLVVRFQRMSPKTSEFIKRAVAHNADRGPLSSPLATSPALMKPPVPRPTEPPKTRSKTPPPETKTDSLPAPPSRRPPGITRTSRPPTDGMTRGHIENRSNLLPDGPRAQRASVIPAARRVSTQPPPTPISVHPPTLALVDETNPKSIDAPSNRATTGMKLSGTPKVPAEDSHHDTDAMARLRQRGPNKPITVPPDREAILARLKKP